MPVELGRWTIIWVKIIDKNQVESERWKDNSSENY